MLKQAGAAVLDASLLLAAKMFEDAKTITIQVLSDP